MDLNYKSFGQGDPIVILHGLFGTLDNWQTIAKALAETHTVYIVDQRNHGRSPHFSTMSYALMAEDLKEFMESHWIFKAHIIGHSMGGKTAMQFAADHPEMVDKLVIVDIGPQAYPGGHQEIFDALFALDLKKLDSRKEAAALLKPKIPDAGVRQFLLKNLTRDKSNGYRWKMNLPVIYENYNDILRAIEPDVHFERKTLFIRGGKSNYIRDQDIPVIKSKYPSAKVTTIEKAGHWVHAEAPEAFLQAVQAFLN